MSKFDDYRFDTTLFGDKDFKKNVRLFKDYLYYKQLDFEDNDKPKNNNLDQSVRLNQRIITLLNLYTRSLEGIVYDEGYLEQYL